MRGGVGRGVVEMWSIVCLQLEALGRVICLGVLSSIVESLSTRPVSGWSMG